MQVPAQHYRPSLRAFPDPLPAIEYGGGDQVRRVQDHGALSFKGQRFRISKALCGYPVALRPTTESSQWQVFFCTQCIATIDLRDPRP
jgi:hypothetical protein